MPSPQQFNITLPDDIAQMLKEKVLSGEYANESDVILDGLYALKSNEDAHHQSTLEGLADFEAGRIVAHEDAKQWAKSLLAKQLSPVLIS